jgi:hypothetical protein
MRKLWFNARAIAVALAFALPLSAQVTEGDRLYAMRAEGAAGGRAKAAPIDGAIAAYRRGVAENPSDLMAHARLMRALRFKGAYVATTSDEKKSVYGTAKAAGEAALVVAARALAAKGVQANASEKKVAEAARAIPGVADVYLWDAINWGEWALAYGKLAAARQGAADRILRGATIAHLADAKLEDGSPSRVLGRLHDQTPRIPFVTGWASSKEAVRFLEQSLSLDPSNKLTMLFLAEALASSDSSKKPRAAELLNRVINEPVHAAFRVEDAAAIEDARRLLAKWK